MSGENYVGLDKQVTEAHITNIGLALASAKENLSSALDRINYAEQLLESLFLNTKNHSTQSGTHVCKCKEKSSKEQTSTCGENTKMEDQPSPDLASLVSYYSKRWELDELSTLQLLSLIIK